MCNGVYSYWVRPGSCVQHCNRVPFIMPNLLHSFIKICCFKRQNRKVFKATLFAIDCKYLHFPSFVYYTLFLSNKGGTWTPINFAVDLILSSLAFLILCPWFNKLCTQSLDTMISTMKNMSE